MRGAVYHFTFLQATRKNPIIGCFPVLFNQKLLDFGAETPNNPVNEVVERLEGRCIQGIFFQVVRKPFKASAL
jgi:hypothetical protein